MTVSSIQSFFKLALINIICLDLSNEQLKRKIDVCQDVIRIYDKVDPGQTSQRTNVLFELHSARIIEQKRLAHYKDSQSREKVLVS